MEIDDPDFRDNARTIVSIAKRNVEAFFGPGAKSTARARPTSVDSTVPLTRSQQVYQTIASIHNQSCSSRPHRIISESSELLVEGSETNFPAKLFSALGCDQFKGSIAWSDEGDAWKILNLETFLATTLLYFTGGATREHFHAFFRLLNLWGFHQIEAGTDAVTFRHEQFHRDQSALVKSMKPKTNVPTDSESSPTSEIIVGDDSYKNFPANSHQDEDIVASIERCLNSRPVSKKFAAADEILNFPAHGHDPSASHNKDPEESLPPTTYKEGTTVKPLQRDVSKHGSALLRALGHTTAESSTSNS